MTRLPIEQKGQVVGLKQKHNPPISDREVGGRLGVPRQTVTSIMKHYNTFGPVKDRPRAGRPPLLDSDSQNRLVRAITPDPKVPSTTFAETAGVSARTVTRVAATHGLRSRICHKKSFISNANKKKRPKWAKDNEGTSWRRVMYTDEAALRIGETGVERCLRRVNTQYGTLDLSTKLRPGTSIHV
jgi:transposase